MGINFKAALHSVKIDHDGECKIVMKISLAYRQSILSISEWTEKVLDVNIALEPEPQKAIEESKAAENKDDIEEVEFE